MTDQQITDIESLFYALMDNECASHEDIADATGWTTAKVGYILGVIRRPEVAEEWGWTVPHVPRGMGSHCYQVIAVDGSSAVGEPEREAIQAGAMSTLRTIATEGENEAHALRVAAPYYSPTLGRKLRRLAKQIEFCASEAREEIEVLTNM